MAQMAQMVILDHKVIQDRKGHRGQLEHKDQDLNILRDGTLQQPTVLVML
jgi:hypothetical protein